MNSKSTEPTATYTAQDILVMEGLEAVRKRPGMYIGGVHKAGMHHLLWEVVDNSIDEAMNGHASEITVKLHTDGATITVEDNGRGIPVDVHPVYNKPALELILTTLHSGGKFESKNYAHSGGLHGVGVSVVNALSDKLIARVKRDGKCYEQNYSKGQATDKLSVVKKGVRGTGTSITFRPDATIFQTAIKFSTEIILERLDISTYLHRGLKIHFHNEVDGSKQTFFHEGGLQDFLGFQIKAKNKKTVHDAQFEYDFNNGIRIEAAMAWTESTDEQIHSFVNGIPTRSGGSHENGLKTAIVKAMRQYTNTHKMLPKGLSTTADDIREGLVALLSVYIEDPQFQGQTKERLNNPEVQPQVMQALHPAIEQWLHDNSSIAKAIVNRIVMAAKARQASRAASQMVRRQSPTRRLTLPGKLADCSETNPRKSELFIVEGDSAGGSAKMGRERKTQAILPLRGKVLNTETASLKKVLGNKELSDLIQALGCGIGKDFKPENLRYGKVILLMDADADGHHISTLLLTFFYRHLPGLIQKGHVYLAQPPLYRIAVGKKIHWALDDNEKDYYLNQAPENAKIDIQRFKGLGEMMPQTLRDTTLDPKKRTLLRVGIEDELQTDIVFNNLLGREASSRFRFIMEHAHEVDEIDMGA